MGDRPVIRSAAAAALSIAIGCSLFAAPAASQSITDRFKSLFGGKSEEPAAAPAAPAERSITDEGGDPDLTCPPVAVRAGASTFAVGAPGKQAAGNDLSYQATIGKTARECTIKAGQITARIGIQGRVIAGPAGAPSSVQVPLRVAVVQAGVGEKVIATKAYTTTVSMSEDTSVPFSIVADELVYPAPSGTVADSYVFYIGFDPQALKPEPKARPKKKQ
ncbi:hypothetical protein JQ628_09095 [Bradyrhizobium lablabi]|uniref:hypothetical protein n=1 Tax=Bradyrhizobium lablabi TaxID=722472 RepID=UPI001BABCFCF|nr:hypothetical protein [Bradyrhizobium lablabi]MBR1121663.1 hypothetical protein [Bradyrhizobium lablabi]